MLVRFAHLGIFAELGINRHCDQCFPEDDSLLHNSYLSDNWSFSWILCPNNWDCDKWTNLGFYLMNESFFFLISYPFLINCLRIWQLKNSVSVAVARIPWGCTFPEGPLFSPESVSPLILVPRCHSWIASAVMVKRTQTIIRKNNTHLIFGRLWGLNTNIRFMEGYGMGGWGWRLTYTDSGSYGISVISFSFLCNCNIMLR